MGMRSWIYDRALLSLTAGWYQEVLERLEPHARLLDVGIGTGSALASNAGLVRDRNLQVTGLDIDSDYVRQCRRAMQRGGIADCVEAVLKVPTQTALIAGLLTKHRQLYQDAGQSWEIPQSSEMSLTRMQIRNRLAVATCGDVFSSKSLRDLPLDRSATLALS